MCLCEFVVSAGVLSSSSTTQLPVSYQLDADCDYSHVYNRKLINGNKGVEKSEQEH